MTNQPESKKFFIKLSDYIFESRSCHPNNYSKDKPYLMDVDFRKHPAWNKDSGNVINQSNKSVSDFNKRFSGLSFSGKKEAS